MSDYNLLGLRPGASHEDAKRARNKLVRQLHPDRPENKGSDPSKLAEINAAFDRILAGTPKLEEAARAAQPRERPTPYRDFEDFDAQSSSEEARPSSSSDRRSESRYRRDPDDFQNQYSRERPGQRHSRQEQGSTGQGSQSSAQAARDFYARARAGGFDRQEEIRRKAEDRAAREASAAAGRDQSAAPEPTLNASMDQREQMRQAIEKRKKQEAYRRVTELRGGIYPDPRERINTNRGDLPGFHIAEHVRFQGRTMQIHIANEAKDGRNIIAMPEMEMLDGRTIRQGRGVKLFELFSAAGAGMKPIEDGKSPVGNAAGLKVEVVFGSEIAKKMKRETGARE